jgi:dATP pyrophosphohydrolase
MIPVVSHIIEVVVFRVYNDRPEYLIMQRALHERVHPGMWQIITGMVEEGEKGSEAAVRELREEAGLVPVHLWSLPLVNSFYDIARDTVNMCPVFAVQADPGAIVTISEEHMASEWLPLAPAKARLVWPGHREAVDMVENYIVRGGEVAERLIIRHS